MQPRPEHPNPLFMRGDYHCLNGVWTFSSPVTGRREILVPFCPESRLSGIGCSDFIGRCTYVKTFTPPALKAGERLFLKFGAVDYAAEVYVNGLRAAGHRGGYTPFCADIAPFLKPGENEIRVEVTHDLSANLPSGKQSGRKDSYGCFYSRVTGIWQTVWLERAPEAYIASVRFFPDPDRASVDAEISVEGEGTAEIAVFYEGRQVGFARGGLTHRRRFTLPLSERRLWEPGQGRLYDVTVRFGGDEVKSYFGLRAGSFSGRKFLLNGATVFQRLVLDQGYNPDGLYTPPDEESMIRDITLALSLGFNGARLHQKAFEPRFLYHCDRMGYMVWGEFPSWGAAYDNLQALGAVAAEWAEVVERDFNHPSIVMWCPLNETWENLDDPRKVRDVRFVDAMYALTKALDPTRPCVDVSGGFHGHKTDLYDFHDYLGPAALGRHIDALEQADRLIMDKVYPPDSTGEYLRYPPGAPTCASEYGGMSYTGGGGDGWGYTACKTEEEFVSDYVALTGRLMSCEKLSGFCYTQLYDVEQEQNGLFRYDRSHKLSAAALKEIAACNGRPAAIETGENGLPAFGRSAGLRAPFENQPETDDIFYKESIAE